MIMTRCKPIRKADGADVVRGKPAEVFSFAFAGWRPRAQVQIMKLLSTESRRALSRLELAYSNF